MSAAAGAVFVLRAGICARLQQRRCLRACGAPRLARHRSGSLSRVKKVQN